VAEPGPKLIIDLAPLAEDGRRLLQANGQPFGPRAEMVSLTPADRKRLAKDQQAAQAASGTRDARAAQLDEARAAVRKQAKKDPAFAALATLLRIPDDDPES
jgi:hypothetical protein